MENVRSHNEGTIFQRKADGLTVVEVSWPDGSRYRRYVPRRFAGKALQAESNRLLREMLNERDAGLGKPTRLTLEAWLRTWLAEVDAAPRGAATTKRKYRSICENSIIPELGSYPLKSLSDGVVQRWLDGMTDAPNTVKHRRDVLRRALNVALRRRMIAVNVAAGAELPDMSQRAPIVLTGDQCRTLLEGTDDDWYGALWAVLLGTGLRISEALGLIWDNVDLDAATLTADRQLARVDGAWVRVKMKATRTFEDIAIPAFAVDALRAHKVKMAAARRDDWAYFGHVFVTPRGQPPQSSRMNVELDRATKRLGLPSVNPHDLRHTSMTLLRAAGIDEQTRMDRAGHNTAAMSRHYAHGLSEENRAAADALQAVVAGR